MDSALAVVCVALGGFIGAPARFLADRAVSRRYGGDFPLGTFVINVAGSFLLGLLTGLDLSGNLPVLVKAAAGTGFCGAFTTFSTWSFETVRLVERQEYTSAGVNVVGSLVLGLAAAAAGLALGMLR